jgi:hypothetical protein
MARDRLGLVDPPDDTVALRWHRQAPHGSAQHRFGHEAQRSPDPGQVRRYPGPWMDEKGEGAA